MTRKRIVLLLIVLQVSAYSVAGCAPIPTAIYPSATPLFDIGPTPALELASAYTAGTDDIPSGKYLVVEAWSDSNGVSSNGTCPYASMVDMPMYYISGGKLVSYMQPAREYSEGAPQELDLSKAVGFMGYGFSHSGDMGGGASSDLTVIESLPVNPKKSIFTIFSAAADGTIVVQIGSQVYRMKPGERWVQYSESQPDEYCHLLDTSTFTNHGLLDASRIDIVNMPLAPALTPTP